MAPHVVGPIWVKSRRVQRKSRCLLWANSGHRREGSPRLSRSLCHECDILR